MYYTTIFNFITFVNFFLSAISEYFWKKPSIKSFYVIYLLMKTLLISIVNAV